MKALFILAIAAMASGCAAQKVSQTQVSVPEYRQLSCTGTHLHRRCRGQYGHPAIQVKTAPTSSPLGHAAR
jgi:hypothetical protein